MMKTTRLLLIACIGITLFSCQKSEIFCHLIQIEGYIQDAPAMALDSLRLIDLKAIRTPKEKGLYHLLLSMALDKNYIDIDSDSLIRPAVDYYSKTLDKYHLFLSYYYLGRVFENAEDYQKALDSYIMAESSVSNRVSKEYLSRLYARKGRVYLHQFAFDKAYEEVDKYSRISVNLPDKRFYIRSMLDKVSYRLINRKHEEAQLYLDSLETWMVENNYQKDALFYESRLPILIELHPGQIDSIRTIRDIYLHACDVEGRTPDYLMLANSYVKTKEPDKAYDYLIHCEPTIQFDVFEYYATLSEIYKAKGDYKSALDAVVKMDKTLADINISVFNNDVRFIEERQRYEIQRIKANTIRLWLILGTVLLSFAIALIVLVALRKRRVIQKELNDAREEYKLLQSFTEKSDNKPESFSLTLNERLAALRPFAISSVGNYSQKNLAQLSKVSRERREFLLSTGLLYAMTYPRFVGSLIDLGLSPEEIGLCSLYISGYSSKELNNSRYFGNVYRINSGIRSKLGIPANGEKLLSKLKELYNGS